MENAYFPRKEKKRKLSENEFWEETEDGSKILVEIDPLSREKYYNISYDILDSDIALIFDIHINNSTRMYNVLSWTILKNLNKDDYEFPYN